MTRCESALEKCPRRKSGQIGNDAAIAIDFAERQRLVGKDAFDALERQYRDAARGLQPTFLFCLFPAAAVVATAAVVVVAAVAALPPAGPRSGGAAANPSR